MSADFFIAFGVWVLLCAALWACVNALRKRAKDGCYPPSPDMRALVDHEMKVAEAFCGLDPMDLKFDFGTKGTCPTNGGAPHLPDCRCSPPTKEEILASKARGLADRLLEADRMYFGQVPHPFDFMSGNPDLDSDRMPIMDRLQQKQVAFPAYVKALSDKDLWAMKGLSGPLAKIRKTEMDVRRRRKARLQSKQTIGPAARTDIIGHVDGAPVFVNPQGSLTLEDPKEVIVAKDPIFDTGADANGAPVLGGPSRWRTQLTQKPGKALVFGPYPESDGLVATIDIFKHTISSVYVEATQPFPEGGDVFERMDADYEAWKAKRA